MFMSRAEYETYSWRRVNSLILSAFRRSDFVTKTDARTINHVEVAKVSLGEAT